MSLPLPISLLLGRELERSVGVPDPGIANPSGAILAIIPNSLMAFVLARHLALSRAAPAPAGVSPPRPNAGPVASFDAAPEGLKVTFTDKSTDQDGQITERIWMLGDGTTSAEVNPVKTYDREGDYLVALLVKDDKEATASTWKSVKVSRSSPPPVAAFSASVNGLKVKFTDKSTSQDGKVVKRAWDFGDGSVSAEVNPSKDYTESREYAVKLTVTDDRNASATTEQKVKVGG